MEIKSKFNIKETVLYYLCIKCIVTGKSLNTKTNEWKYFIENNLLRIFEWVKEDSLKQIK